MNINPKVSLHEKLLCTYIGILYIEQKVFKNMDPKLILSAFTTL
jgi:hypothetical protein